MGGGLCTAIINKGLVDVGHADMQALDGTALEQFVPAGNGVVAGIYAALDGDGCRGGGGRLAYAFLPGHQLRRAHDAVAHDHQGHGGTADDIYGWRCAGFGAVLDVVLADIALNKGFDARLRNTDQDNGFMVFQQLGGDDAAIHAHGNQRSEEHTSELQSRENLV